MKKKKACSIYDLSAEGVFVNVDFDVLGHPENNTRKGIDPLWVCACFLKAEWWQARVPAS